MLFLRMELKFKDVHENSMRQHDYHNCYTQFPPNSECFSEEEKMLEHLFTTPTFILFSSTTPKLLSNTTQN